MVDSVWAHCNRCLDKRRHSPLFTNATTWDGDFAGGEQYELLQCLGCDHVTVRHTRWYNDSPSMERVDYYPPAFSRRKPSWLTDRLLEVPYDVSVLTEEIYSALQNGSLTLASIGIRTALDIVMTDKLGDVGGFKAKLQRFCDSGHISKVQHEQLEHVINAGSASAHRGYTPIAEHVDTALDIMEGLVRSLYVDASRAAQLGKNVPPRKP